MTIADISIFLGRFHPLLVHLPIGFLLLSALLIIPGSKEKYRSLQPAIPFALLAGTICAIFACVTGFLLSFSGDYDQYLLSVHMIGGFTTAAVSLFAYLLSRRIIAIKFLQTGRALFITMIVMVTIITLTGHFGGTLTHGANYISSNLLFGPPTKQKQIADIGEAFIYEDLVQPILEKKCSNCHNANKRKGQLSMESYQSLMKGGKHGLVIERGHSDKSELIKRVSLDVRDEKFMPADNKPSLTENEKSIITWWIDEADATIAKKVKESAVTAAVTKDITTYLGIQNNDSEVATGSDSSNNYFALLKLPQVTEQQLSTLKDAGLVVKYLNLKPVLLDVTIPENRNAVADSINVKLKLLLGVKDNILWLNVAGNNISDSQLQTIGELRNLRRLRLDNNPIKDVRQLKNLINLESINLYNTKVTTESIAGLSSLTKLKHMYVWGTGVKKEEATLKMVTGVR